MKRMLLFVNLVFVSGILFAQTPAYRVAPGADSVVDFTPEPLGPLCPKKLITGDRDFSGRGPEVWASVILTWSRSAVIATVKYRAKETPGGDNSETEGMSMKIIYSAPRGTYITGVTGGKRADVHFISKPGLTSFAAGGLAKALSNVPASISDVGSSKTVASKSVTDNNDGLVKTWEIYGDTGGTDISTDDNCNDDTRIRVILNNLKINLRKTDASMGIATIKLEDINEWLCPNKLTRGDREFDGHGPRIKSEVKLRIGDRGHSLYADITFWAQETVHDFTTTEGKWSKLVYEAPYGKKITEIISDKASRTQLISPPGGFQFLVPGADVARAVYTFLDATDIKSAVLAAFGYKPEEKSAISALIKGTIDNGNTVVQVPPVEGTLVKFFHIVGDTGGADVSHDDNCNDDTRIVKIEFFPARVKMKDE